MATLPVTAYLTHASVRQWGQVGLEPSIVAVTSLQQREQQYFRIGLLVSGFMTSVASVNFGERRGHTWREWKPEFKEGRCPPLDVPPCSLSHFVKSCHRRL